MSSTMPLGEGPAPDSPSDVRALPARPNLEFEHKQAKKLLALLRDGNAEALARVHAKLKGSAERKPGEFKLADAQFTIAREYGFTSWPRLVEYFETVERHGRSGARDRHPDRGGRESWARSIIAGHRRRSEMTAQCLAAFVPRLFGRTVEEVFASDVSEDEARLVVARMNRYPSWDAMIADFRQDEWASAASPLRKAVQAVRAEDDAMLAELVRDHPELLTASDPDQPGNIELARSALLHDIRTEAPGLRHRIEWLGGRMVLSSTLNWMLLGHWRMPPGAVRMLLECGADPSWVAPNGYSVLEHAICRYWSGESVDLVAEHVRPPEALWVSAGLGNARAVATYFDRAGNLTPAARMARPDFVALAVGFPPVNPGADDRTVVWEAFLVAALNQRFGVLDALIDRGFPVDYSGWGMTVLQLAIGNQWLPLVEYLVDRGATVDASALSSAEHRVTNRPDNADARRILALCGGRDPEVVLKEHAEREASRTMGTAAAIEMAFSFAKQDAVRSGLSAVTVEALFVGLLRLPDTPWVMVQGGVDPARLKTALSGRLDAPEFAPPADMTSDPETTALLLEARADAERRKDGILMPFHVFVVLMNRRQPQVMEWITQSGGSQERILYALEQRRYMPST